MTNQHGLEGGDRVTRGLQTSEVEEIEIEELDAEIGFIISSSCTSLELEEDEDLLEDTLGAVEEHSPDKVMPHAP
jgi:hypothetical protein